MVVIKIIQRLHRAQSGTVARKSDLTKQLFKISRTWHCVIFISRNHISLLLASAECGEVCPEFTQNIVIYPNWVAYTYFRNTFLAVLYISLALMFHVLLVYTANLLSQANHTADITLHRTKFSLVFCLSILTDWLREQGRSWDSSTHSASKKNSRLLWYLKVRRWSLY